MIDCQNSKNAAYLTVLKLKSPISVKKVKHFMPKKKREKICRQEFDRIRCEPLQEWADKNAHFVMIQGLALLAPYVGYTNLIQSCYPRTSDMFLGINIDNLPESDFEKGDIFCLNGKFFEIYSETSAIATGKTLIEFDKKAKAYERINNNHIPPLDAFLRQSEAELNEWFESCIKESTFIIFPKRKHL